MIPGRSACKVAQVGSLTKRRELVDNKLAFYERYLAHDIPTASVFGPIPGTSEAN